MSKHDFPKIHFYDQDFVDIYNKTWSWTSSFWIDPKKGEQNVDGLFIYPENDNLIINQFETILSSFFLVYSNRNFEPCNNLDYFYKAQEESGAIRWKYDVKTGEPVFDETNPEGVGLPLFAYAEFNLYHKSANKKRIKEIMPILQKYMTWIDENFRKENGLYSAPVSASTMIDSPRKNVCYPIDFNACMAVNASYM